MNSLNNSQQQQRRSQHTIPQQKKISQTDSKNINYKNLLAQYYDKDYSLNDVHQQIKSIAPEIQILQQLNQFQKQIDSLIKTKRYDVQEIYMKPPKLIKRLLRIHIIKTQGKLKIFGNLIPKFQNAPKFTSFFKQIKVYSGDQKSIVLNWKKPIGNFSERDGIVCSSIQNQNQDISITLSQIFNPPRFQVDQNLKKIVNMKRGSRVQVLQAFWEYVKLKKLQDMQNKQIVNADQLVKNAFKAQKLTFATINNRIRELLIPVESVKIELKGNQTAKTYDLIVQIEQRPNVDIVPFFSQKINQQKNDHPYLSLNSKIKKYEKKFQDHTEKLRRHLAKREIYMNFKPQTIENIIREQYKLLRKLKSIQPIEDYNKLEFILQNQEQVQRQIKHYLEQINVDRNQLHD